MSSIKREERKKRRATDKGKPNGRCIRQEYDEEVVDRKILPDGRLLQVTRGFVKYLHVTKGWRVRATSGLKYTIKPQTA